MNQAAGNGAGSCTGLAGKGAGLVNRAGRPTSPDKEMRPGTPLSPDLMSRPRLVGPVKTRAGPTVPGGYREVRHPALAGPHALLSRWCPAGYRRPGTLLEKYREARRPALVGPHKQDAGLPGRVVITP